ncbi:MAG: YeeE/YedE family protein [Alphaproteobacteria bacterium]
MENFTPYSALAGGALIGVAASILLWLNGRLAGVSGILGGLMRPAAGEARWRLLFLIGLVIGALVFAAAGGDVSAVRVDTGMPVLIAAGLLTGIGTRLGGGCTSGHGVCGVARLSRRSITATATFMVAAGATVFVVRHVIGG